MPPPATCQTYSSLDGLRCPPCAVVAHRARLRGDIWCYTALMSVSDVLTAALRTLDMAHEVAPEIVSSSLLREARTAEADARAAFEDWRAAVDDDCRRRARIRLNRSVAWFGVIVTSTSSNLSRNDTP